MSRRTVAQKSQRTTHPDGLLTKLSDGDIKRVPKMTKNYKSMASTIISQSSEGTYEIEFVTLRKEACVPLDDKMDVSSVFRGRNGNEENVLDGTRCAVSSRSGNRSTLEEDGMAATIRTTSASRSHLSREARSIRSRSAYGNRSTRTSASVRSTKSKQFNRNDSQGDLSRARAATIQSRSMSRSSESLRAHTIRPPAVVALNSTTSFDTPSLTTTSHYPSSHPSLLFDPTQFNAFLCNDLVDYYIIIFSKRSQLDINTKHRHLLLLENNLHHLFRVHNLREAEHIDSANLDINEVVSAPADDARNDRAFRRAARLIRCCIGARDGDGEFDDDDVAYHEKTNPHGRANDDSNGDDDDDPNGNPPGDPAGNSGSGDSTATISADGGSDSFLDGGSAAYVYGDDYDDAAPESRLTWLRQSHSVVFADRLHMQNTLP